MPLYKQQAVTRKSLQFIASIGRWHWIRQEVERLPRDVQSDQKRGEDGQGEHALDAFGHGFAGDQHREIAQEEIADLDRSRPHLLYDGSGLCTRADQIEIDPSGAVGLRGSPRVESDRSSSAVQQQPERRTAVDPRLHDQPDRAGRRRHEWTQLQPVDRDCEAAGCPGASRRAEAQDRRRNEQSAESEQSAHELQNCLQHMTILFQAQ